MPWTLRTVEHLLNRAGFGGTQAEIAAAVAKSPAEVVDDLLATHEPWERFVPEFGDWLSAEDIQRLHIPAQVARAERKRLRALDGIQFLVYSDRWFEAMRRHAAPVRDRMTLFWHGFFTTSFVVVFRSYELIQQHQTLRFYATRSYAELLDEMLRGPAILKYLDNDTSVRGQPNENFARELMELFSLGEGHYSERDVRETARALTGYGCNALGGFQFFPEQHDWSQKTVFGETGPFDAEDIARLILAQEQCARWVAESLIAYFEGVAPDTARRDAYAALLMNANYELQPFLRALFLDPEFYRDGVVGTRVQGPIEWTIAALRKLDIKPPGGFVYRAAGSMGQTFYQPPTVQGWHGGEAWITSETLMSRGNSIGVLLDTFGLAAEEDRAPPLTTAGTGGRASEAMADTVVELRRLVFPPDWQARTRLRERLLSARATTDAEIVEWMLEELMAVAPFADTQAHLLAFLASERRERALSGPLLDDDNAEELLRRLAPT